MGDLRKGARRGRGTNLFHQRGCRSQKGGFREKESAGKSGREKPALPARKAGPVLVGKGEEFLGKVEKGCTGGGAEAWELGWWLGGEVRRRKGKGPASFRKRGEITRPFREKIALRGRGKKVHAKGGA